ncbi:MAG: SDR family oxidoreductase [Chloroflexi bacterium]|nr:SDR family oxidoreductase [Chloroflexota bacterium]
MADLSGKVGFITGGGTGIGLACAKSIVEGGGKVAIGGRRTEVVEAAASELGDSALAVQCDVTSQESVDAAVAATVDHFGALHIAVNAAGIGGAGHILNSTAEQFAAVLDTNLTGVFRSMHAEAQTMREGGGGSIVNISSIAAALTHRQMSAYCAAKAGLNMLTQCAADDMGEFGIRVNAVMPGLTKTDLAQPLTSNEAVVEEYKRRMPISRLGEPGDVAAMVVFLLGDDASWITGQCIGVDGGHTIRQGPDLVEPLFSKFLPQ